MRVLALGVVAVLLAAGCGQKGPLYLPDRNHTAVTPGSAQPQPAQPAQSGATAPKKNNPDETTQPPQQ
jgi:predicted small lipoprotein YifL